MFDINQDIPWYLATFFIVGGLVLLSWSADRFVAVAARIARALGVSPFVVGMVIIGFGTSAPELAVSALSGVAGHANLSLGNAYGSCVFNITAVLGLSVLIFPLVVRPYVAIVSGTILSALALFSLWLLWDGACSRGEAFALLGVFALLLPAYCWFDRKMSDNDAPAVPAAPAPEAPLRWFDWAWLLATLALLVGASHFLVWGAVDTAKAFGVSDLMIGLTIVAIGTSLPELASGIASARRGEHEFVLGNVVGSNFFNTLAVVGIATAISPISPANGGFSPYVLWRDLPVMLAASASIALFGTNLRHLRRPGVIRRWEAAVWLGAYVAYAVVMFLQEKG